MEEANGLLPKVQEILKSLRQQRDEMDAMEGKKAVEELSWLRHDGTVSPQAKEEVSRLEKVLEERTHSFEERLMELDRLGAQLKDLDEGLIDFFAARGSELVYLCWRQGEDKIRFWHDLESGFSGRRVLEEL